MRLNPFALPSPEKLVRDELQTAQRELLHWQSTLECARAMTEYNTQRVARLEATAAKNFALVPKGVDSFHPVLG